MKKQLLLFLLLPTLLIAKENSDSLWSVWNNENQTDTNRLEALSTLNWNIYLSSNPDSAFYFAQLQLDFATEKGAKRYMADALKTQGVSLYIRGIYDEALNYQRKSLGINKEIENKRGIANNLINIGNVFGAQGNYNKAINSYTESLKIQDSIKNKIGIALALNNLGLIYNNQGKTDRAIEYYTKSLKVNKELGNKIGIASSLNNIGIIYFEQGEMEKAKDYYTRSLRIQEQIGDNNGMTKSLNNIGNIFYVTNETDKAIEYFLKSLKIQEEMSDKRGMALALNNLGNIYVDLGEIRKALDFFTNSLSIREEIGDKSGISQSLNGIGNVYQLQKHYQKAIEYNQRSLAIAQEINNAKLIRSAAESLWKLNKTIGKAEQSLKMHELFIKIRDSIKSNELQKEVIKQEYKYAYEKQAAEDSVKAAEAAKLQDALLMAERAKNEKKQQQSYFLYLGLIMAILFGAFIFNRFRLANKQKAIIASQKLKVDLAYDGLEEAHKEITDSIQYAKRIQSAILPPIKLVKKYLPNSFIFYNPKDVVAGDFYWLDHKDGKVLFAAADCTGHGVPGAMVSVVCNNGLNRSVREYGLTDPAKILDKTREIVISEFEKSEDDVQDGMDIALCSIDGYILQYAGANNPLWIIRNGELLETKANKQPIGSYENLTPFTCHSFNLQKGDSIYLFSDGFVDQFGGKKEKKLKPRAFKELLLSIQSESMEKQGESLGEFFENWRGDLEQIDDVCVIGVKV